MLKFILNKIFGDPSSRECKRLIPLVDQVNALEDEIRKLSDEEIESKRQEFIKRHKEGESLLDLRPEAFAVAREACRRNVGMRHFDVQLIGGSVLFDGKIAEMSTGEGKTLVAVLPVYLQSIAESNIFVVTVNDYLAMRDAEWMGPAYRALGLSVGFVQSGMELEDRKNAYKSDVIYITNNEAGFDYLRDNMAVSPHEQVQGSLDFAIIDEVDSVLIDEARTPLIISGPAGESSDKYRKVNTIIPRLDTKYLTEEEEVDIKKKFESEGKKGDYRDELEKKHDAIADEKRKNFYLTEKGMKKCEELLSVNLFDDIEGEWVHHINQAGRAHHFFKIDVNYVIKEGEVVIVDEFTGRLMPGRRWSEGLHQAVEAKEGIKPRRESQTYATITFQNFFNLFDKLAGMTGTALTEENEFNSIYSLPVVEIPTNKNLQREKHPDAVYRNEKEKFAAVVQEIEEFNSAGRPVLVGSRSIEVSERLSGMLQRRGIKHNVLNAKQHLREAEIVAQAGRKNAVTISTNMAGRGTDIILGGNPEYLAREEMARNDWDHELIVRGSEKSPPKNEEEKKAKETFKKYYEKFKVKTDAEHDEVIELGGLHVVGTERHESRRIDNQLRGRAGRQGDPGSSRFFVALEDELMRLFGGDRIMAVMDKMGGMQEGERIEHPLISNSISRAQKRVEAMNFDIRKQLLDYDNVMDKQRRSIYSHRNSILHGEDIEDEILGFIDDYVDLVLEENIDPKAHPEEWDIKALSQELFSSLGLDLKLDIDQFMTSGHDGLRKHLEEEIKNHYRKRKETIGQEEFSNMERFVLLRIMDSRWKDHLYELDQLKSGISYRAYGQKDPLVEYKKESFMAFAQLMDNIKRESLTYIFRASSNIQHQRVQRAAASVQARKPEARIPEEHLQAARRQQVAGRSAGEKKVQQRVVDEKVGRNDPCPCGSGRKHKHCCGR